MPSNNLYAELTYQIPKLGEFQNIRVGINNRFVFEQKNLRSNQDFVDPPESYYLVGLELSAEKQLRKLRLNMFVKTENTLNKAYRDYLNRQRYFADDLGFNMIAGMNVSF
jgi:iron complex outermembrane receptor protein